MISILGGFSLFTKCHRFFPLSAGRLRFHALKDAGSSGYRLSRYAGIASVAKCMRESPPSQRAWESPPMFLSDLQDRRSSSAASAYEERLRLNFFDSFEFLEVPVRRKLFMAWRTQLQVGMSQIRLLNHPRGRGLVALLTRSGYYTRRASGGSSSQVLNEEKRAAAEAVYIKVQFHSLSQRALPETSYEHRSRPPDWRIHAISTARLFPVSAEHRQEHCEHSLQTNARVSRECSSIASINIKAFVGCCFLQNLEQEKLATLSQKVLY
jgi:hypothetical protein